MEKDGFGPSKLKSNRFTVCPLWPLGNFSLFNHCRNRFMLVGATGLEPAASWSQTKHSTKLSYASSNSFIIIQRFDSFVNSFFENCKIRYQKNQFRRIYYANSTKLKPTQKGRLKASYSINKFMRHPVYLYSMRKLMNRLLQ